MEKLNYQRQIKRWSVNFEGLTTKGNIVIATGTTDNKIYVLNSKNGKTLWEFEMHYVYSSPAMTYLYEAIIYCN